MTASLLTILAAARRREILRAIWDRELPAGEIHARVPEVTFGAVSQHLKRLREAGAVSVRRDGRYRFYRARRDALGPLATVLEQEWEKRLDRLKALAEAEEEGETT